MGFFLDSALSIDPANPNGSKARDSAKKRKGWGLLPAIRHQDAFRGFLFLRERGGVLRADHGVSRIRTAAGIPRCALSDRIIVRLRGRL
jgi:hypothetical protein